MADSDIYYRGYRLYWHTVINPRDLQPQLVCSVRNLVGIWNSEQAAKDYVDWLLDRAGAHA